MPDPILHPAVATQLQRLRLDHEVLDCDPEFADTAAFCLRYGVDPADSGNTIVVTSRRPAGVDAACVVLATTRLDVNRAVRDELAVKKLSFASAEHTSELTGMDLGGVTVLGLPDGLPILLDSRVVDVNRLIVGGGNRHSKVRLNGADLTRLPDARVVEALAIPIA